MINDFTFYIEQIIGAGMFIMTVWIRAEPSFEEWVQILNIYVYYIGIYILIAASVIVLIVSFLGCCSALMEHTSALFLVRIWKELILSYRSKKNNHSEYLFHIKSISLFVFGEKISTKNSNPVEIV